MTYQIVSTKTKDSVSFIIVGKSPRVRDEYETEKIFLRLHIYCFNFLHFKGFLT